MSVLRARILITLKPSDLAWIALALGVFGWDLFAEETLSQAAQRYACRHPWLSRGIVLAFAAHLLCIVPDKYDPLHWVFEARQRYRLSQ